MGQDERKFLHDVANPIATALFVADALAEDIADAVDLPNKALWIEQMNEIVAALEKSRDLIKSRRDLLIGGSK